MSFLIPIRIAPVEEAVIDASAPSERVGIVMQACAGCQPASNFQPASACNFQPRLRLQNLLSRESTGGSRARRGVPSWLTQRRVWEGPVGPPGQRTGGGLWIRSGS
ncbi:hypothetical protein SAMN02982917_5579 [Azospirillum oryzae]|uniref:Uncharacterized protein n=1 Tax=Azospirillum oryzae TaxID=286727 RepID=A0A1X7HC28_9PROT|nr:hypothetical protein SAMN02982917_5579 [Azospirillum oryzae]